jgi:type II secretory pathway pseudopilin PulG
MINSKQNGYGLIEIIVATTVVAMVFLGVSECLNSFLKIALQNTDTTEALFLAKSSLEQTRAVRDEGNEGEGDLDWINIPDVVMGDSYHFESNGTSPEKWVAQAGTKSEGKYTVWITASEVRRDDNDDIVSTGGTYTDLNTLKITSNVSWSTASGAKQINLFEYLTNFR